MIVRCMMLRWLES